MATSMESDSSQSNSNHHHSHNNNNNNNNNNQNHNNNHSHSHNKFPRTILRIKRRRTEEPLPYIRLEGVERRSRRNNHHHYDDSSASAVVTTPPPLGRPTTKTASSSSSLSLLSASSCYDQREVSELKVAGSSTHHHHNNNNNSNSNSNNHNNNQSHKRKMTSSVLWKRVLEPEQMGGTSEEHALQRVVVDAVLEEDDHSEPGGDGGGRMRKRRKLTVLDSTISTTSTDSTRGTSNLQKRTATATDAGTGGQRNQHANVVINTRRRKTTLKVLDPLTRLVDDSLQEVHQGSKPLSEHLMWVMTDPRLSHESKRWFQWCHSSGGNILHACSLWNDVEVAREVLELTSRSSLGGGDVASMTDAVDGDGRTPYEVAQLSGHDSVCQILEAFGGDTTNFVYDIFCLEEIVDSSVDTDTAASDQEEKATTSKKEKTSDDLGWDESMTVELTSGVGYWTPDGELVLESGTKQLHTGDDDGDDDDDGEIDSNCEEYGGNDYPDDPDSDDDNNLEYYNPYQDDEPFMDDNPIGGTMKSDRWMHLDSDLGQPIMGSALRRQPPTTINRNNDLLREEADYQEFVHDLSPPSP